MHSTYLAMAGDRGVIAAVSGHRPGSEAVAGRGASPTRRWRFARRVRSERNATATLLTLPPAARGLADPAPAARAC